MAHDEMIAVIAAHRDGKKIQIKGSLSGIWSDIDTSKFNFLHCEYRVKPEPVEAWAVVTKDGVMFGVYQYRHSAENVVKATATYLRIVRLVEEGGDA